MNAEERIERLERVVGDMLQVLGVILTTNEGLDNMPSWWEDAEPLHRARTMPPPRPKPKRPDKTDEAKAAVEAAALEEMEAVDGS